PHGPVPRQSARPRLLPRTGRGRRALPGAATDGREPALPPAGARRASRALSDPPARGGAHIAVALLLPALPLGGPASRRGGRTPGRRRARGAGADLDGP